MDENRENLPDGFDSMSPSMQENYIKATEKLGGGRENPTADPPPTDTGGDPPSSDPPSSDPPPIKNEINFTELFGEGFNDINAVSKHFKERNQQFDGITKERDELKRKYEKQSKSISEMRGAFTNENLFKLDQISQKYPDKLSLYSQIALNPDTLKPIELVKMDMMSKYPTITDEEAINDLISEEYALREINEEDLSETELADWERKKRLGLTKLQMKAEDVKKALLSTLDEIDVPQKADPEAQVKKIERAKQEWTPVIKGLVDNFKELPIQLPDKDGKLQDFTVHEVGDISELQKNVVDYLANSNRPFEAETMNEAVNFLQSQFILQNFSSIVQTVANHARTLSEDDYLARYTNPTKPNGSRNDDVGKPLSKFEESQKARRATY